MRPFHCSDWHLDARQIEDAHVADCSDGGGAGASQLYVTSDIVENWQAHQLVPEGELAPRVHTAVSSVCRRELSSTWTASPLEVCWLIMILLCSDVTVVAYRFASLASTSALNWVRTSVNIRTTYIGNDANRPALLVLQ